VPLAAGGGDEEWLDALRAKVVPAVERFAPDLIVASAGFDAWQDDPLGGMRVTAAGFAAIGLELEELANRRCAGRTVSVLEGGYDVEALPGLVISYLTGTAAPPGPTAG
jgi:acetoin utilization deacetylase AcuC-like enzyme